MNVYTMFGRGKWTRQGASGRRATPRHGEREGRVGAVFVDFGSEGISLVAFFCVLCIQCQYIFKINLIYCLYIAYM
jgi:hypothetical protein